tara:strand:- start:654 stop:1265 length:612 start_codon:yes stop_codon:yes gene_type:complete
MIKAFIFDFDGVIIDTNNYHFLSWKKSLDDFGIDFSSEDYKKIKGLSRSDSVDYMSLFNKKIEHNKVELLKRKNDIYLELIEDLNSDDLMLGVKDFLINNKKFKLGVASSSRNARYILKKIKCDHFFDIIIDANDICESKPNPKVFLKCADAFGLQPCECIVFEDSENGLLAAKRGGFNTYLVGNDKIKHLADNYINDLTFYK